MMRQSARQTAVTLRPEAEFTAYTARYGAPTPSADAEAIAGTIARKHCAGRTGTIDGARILAALGMPPDADSEDSRVVNWMLATIRAHECALLVAHCGVRHEDLARHVRARPQQKEAIVRFLNQFTIRAGAPHGRRQESALRLSQEP